MKAIDYIRDFDFYARAWLTINDKWGRRVRFVPKASQMAIWRAAQEQRATNMPVRLRILKYRQAGISSYCTAWAQHAAQTHVGLNALSIAHKLDLPAQWLRRCRGWYDELPPALRPGKGATNANELWFDGLQSRYYIGSAQGNFPAMGDTLRFIHCSEMASWPMLGVDPDALLADMLPAVPPGPDTWIVQESTGRSVGDWWYKAYYAAKRGEVDYRSIFLPWYIDPDYKEDDTSDILSPNSEEKALLAVGVTKEQLAWRRKVIRSEFHGDERLFANQFPATEEEAFLSAGANVFTSEEVALAMGTVRKPVWCGEVVPRKNPAEYQMLGTEGGRLLVWKHPRKDRHYAIGADCQWGSKDAADYDAAYVESVEDNEVVARWWGRCDMYSWARTLASLGHYYNKAVLAPERNSEAARGVILPLMGLVGDWRYPNLWVRNKTKPYGSIAPVDFGWLTDAHSKPELVMFIHEAIKSNRGMDWADEGAVEEMASYIVDERMRMTAPPGQNDDRLMARMITERVAHDIRADLASRPMESDYGELTDFQHRVLEYLEREREADERAEMAAAGIEEW